MYSSYKSVDGRFYTSEPQAAPLPVRDYCVYHMRESEKMTLKDIASIEAMLNHTKILPNPLPAEEKNRIIREYGLSQDRPYGKWHGDATAVFEAFCAKFPHARKYKKYSGLLYAMRYGDTPCTIIQAGETA